MQGKLIGMILIKPLIKPFYALSRYCYSNSYLTNKARLNHILQHACIIAPNIRKPP